VDLFRDTAGRASRQLEHELSAAQAKRIGLDTVI
jgi:hypothetical protein